MVIARKTMMRVRMLYVVEDIVVFVAGLKSNNSAIGIENRIWDYRSVKERVWCSREQVS